MASVVVVSRTRMAGGRVCVGGYDLTSRANIRLLTDTGDNQPAESEFHIGSSWSIDYVRRPNITPPHVEDVLVQQSRLVTRLDQRSLIHFIEQNCTIRVGSIASLFDGMVQTPQRAAAFISQSAIPNHSVCFWRPDTDLTHVRAYEKDKYHYVDAAHDTYVPYVGFVDPIAVIPSGTIVRVSLARWWSHSPSVQPACYMQISGWYST